MAEFDQNTRQEISRKLREQKEKRMRKLSKEDRALIQEILFGGFNKKQLGWIVGQFREQKKKKPSQWFAQQGILPGTYAHKGLLDAFVPERYQESYLYIIDKLNRFPFSRGWQRRTVRTRAYWPQIEWAFSLLDVYEKLFYCGDHLEDLIYRRLDEEKMDYIGNEWRFTSQFNLIYAAEIDRGNQAVINAFKDLILSGNNTAYLDREMILGILRSDHQELHKLMGDLLLAARLQEGLRQAICEAMDEGTKEAFMTLLPVIEDNDLIRFSSVQRAVAVWSGIFVNGADADRIAGKLLKLMGRCLREKDFCREQLESEDSIAISIALWAIGFDEVENAIEAMKGLIDHGTRNQKLTVSFYNNTLYDEKLKTRTAKKVIMEHTDDLELVAAFMPAFYTGLEDRITGLLYKSPRFRSGDMAKPLKPVLTDYFQNREEAELQYEKFWSIYERLPKKGVLYSPCIFPWYQVEMKPSEIICQLAFLAYVLEDAEKKTRIAGLLGEVSRDGGFFSARADLLNLLLYCPSDRTQRELLITYMGNAEEQTSDRAVKMVKKLTLEKEDYRMIEDMLRFKRSKLKAELLEFLMTQDRGDMEECLERLIRDKNGEKRCAGLELILRLTRSSLARTTPGKLTGIGAGVTGNCAAGKDMAGKGTAGKDASGKSTAGNCAAGQGIVRADEGFRSRIRALAAEIKKPTDKEKILLEEILEGDANGSCHQKGYGIYDPDAPVQIPEQDEGNDALLQCAALSEQEIIDRLKKLDALFQANKDYEYETAHGERQLLSNGYFLKKFGKDENGGTDGYFGSRLLRHYPLEWELREFYEKEIGSYPVLIQMMARLFWSDRYFCQSGDAQKLYQSVLGKYPFKPLPMHLEYPRQAEGVMWNYCCEFLDKAFLFQAGVQAAFIYGKVVSRQNRNMIMTCEHTWFGGKSHIQSMLVGGLPILNRFMEGLGYWNTDEEFTRAFHAAWKIELRCAEDREKAQFCHNTAGADVVTPIRPYWFLKAYHMGLVSRDILFKAVLNYFDRRVCLNAISQFVKGEYGRAANRPLWKDFFGVSLSGQIPEQGEEAACRDTWCGRLIQELYDAIVPVMLDTELRRGEAPTEFSGEIAGITYIRGTEYLIRILMALGNDPLVRETWESCSYRMYSSGSRTKKEVLCHLLKVSYPAEDDNGAALKRSLKGTGIGTARLVEVAMYAPQWIDVIEDYLGWQGLKSGCYYFMAHMNEYFSDRKKAMIARYTPLSEEELRKGAFDVEWFHEVYGKLGEKNFDLIYKAAKYTSDGQKHARARKYADAASGKVTTAQLREQITEKRNKDLLMSYGLVPFAQDREKDLLERYHFIQQYAREAKQFGSQRRASESEAAGTALVNLSVHAGFSDVTRLILKMESRLAREYAPYMEWHAVEDVEICLHVDEAGKCAVLCRKDGQALKSVPTRLKNAAYVMEVKQAGKKLKEQYSRTRKMLEESMESGEEFTAAEIAGLLENPVVSAILRPLVFISGGSMGLAVREEAAGQRAEPAEREAAAGLDAGALEGKEAAIVRNAGAVERKEAAGLDAGAVEGEAAAIGLGAGIPEGKEAAESCVGHAGEEKNTVLVLRSRDGTEKRLAQDAKLRIVHPLDLYRAGEWHSWQKYLFDNRICQPFKQVFRELYVKMPEELGLTASRMFAGNQIQPGKTVACLKGRRWVADYEEGLQKIYYKENIVARIYALADWFSPGDVEAPTLEWVGFFDRNTFQALTIEQVPDLIYSEVMRDVDLAVSVAHAGGVDPETSHSTIEMRRVIVEFNLPLFKLENVTLKDSHALIRGTRGSYNVHLGSGVVHQEGGAMLNILPVHSQKRGKLFLPFVDEDPKTAEILSKIVLLAEDRKIRDPFILDQIAGI